MTAYYNENDPYAAAWLRNLIAAGHIAPGDVDERSIEDVRPVDLLGYTQCHFFAGIGVWSHALRSAGWPDERPVWTGSCPCQPFSAAGKGGGFADERHLWPAWFHLIAHAKPRDVPVLGEQVASKDGLSWLDVVHADMEGQGYTIGAVDMCAAGVGAPHIRQRLFFVADADEGRGRWDGGTILGSQEETGRSLRRVADSVEPCSAAGPVADADECRARADTKTLQTRELKPSSHRRESKLADANGRDASTEGLQRGGEHGQQQEDGSVGVAQGDTNDSGPQGRSLSGADRERIGSDKRAARTSSSAGVILGDAKGIDRGALLQQRGPQQAGTESGRAGATNGFWRDADWLPCIDGKARPVEPGTFPLAHGAPARVGRLRAYGNAIVAPVATEFIHAYLEGLALSEIL